MILLQFSFCRAHKLFPFAFDLLPVHLFLLVADLGKDAEVRRDRPVFVISSFDL